ncbi:Uncharacterised protein [uncultured archaeon]|nr:Uncharacterised protein [uncultured archaeon]
MNWNKKEIEEYKIVKRKELESFYSKANIPETNPEARIRYIIGLFDKNSMIFTYPSRISIDKLGKVGALKLLEDRIVERFF